MKKSLASMCLSAVLTVAFSYHAVAADLPEIEKSGTLKVATEDDYAPFNFMNNGQADGFNKDMLEELRKYAKFHVDQGNDSNLLIVFYVQIMPDDFVMQLHRF